MNASSLAVIFAPNLLRPAKEPSAMQALEEVKHRTVVIQSIIETTLKKYVSTLAKINTLSTVSFLCNGMFLCYGRLKSIMQLESALRRHTTSLVTSYRVTQDVCLVTCPLNSVHMTKVVVVPTGLNFASITPNY